MCTAIKHPVPDRVNPSFVIFDIRALWRSALSVECPGVKNYKWRLNSVWHRMLYSCTHVATLCVKGLLLCACLVRLVLVWQFHMVENSTFSLFDSCALFPFKITPSKFRMSLLITRFDTVYEYDRQRDRQTDKRTNQPNKNTTASEHLHTPPRVKLLPFT